jgi:methanogenic corrinoid protein MtbC1
MRAASELECFMSSLLAGDRVESRRFIQDKLTGLADPMPVYSDLLWPAMERIDKLYRTDRINAATEHMAVRIVRSIADQVQLSLERRERNGKRILITCADAEPEELGAQMCADLFESRGWEVYFTGGGVPNDEILTLVGQLRPDVLLIFGTQPTGVPGIRRLIDLLQEVGPNPTMNTMVSGGVYNRADGLWKEINADLFAKTAREALEIAEKAEPRTPTIKVVGAPKKRRRRRRPPLLASAEAD